MTTSNINLTDQQIKDLAFEALNAACLHIQNTLGVTDGGYAGQFFSDNEIENKFKEYILSEIQNKLNNTI